MNTVQIRLETNIIRGSATLSYRDAMRDPDATGILDIDATLRVAIQAFARSRGLVVLRLHPHDDDTVFRSFTADFELCTPSHEAAARGLTSVETLALSVIPSQLKDPKA